MLYDTLSTHDYTGHVGDVDSVQVQFTLANEGTKVSMHALNALLGLITSWETMVMS